MSPLLASLLHSLWIGLLCWITARIALRTVPSRLVELRHGVALIATVLVFIGWGGAWIAHRANPESSRVRPEIAELPPASSSPQTFIIGPANTADTISATTLHPASTEQRPPWLSGRIATLRRAATLQTCLELLWLTGAAFGLARLVFGLHAGGSRWLARQPNGTVPEVWLEAWRGRLEQRGNQLKTQLVAINSTGAPLVIGLLKPMIVIPLASCAGINLELARAALAHEFAHVARRDWLVELVLRVIESVLFFNPFVWLLANHVREEREACCDAWACIEADMPRGEFATALAAWARLLMPENRSTAHGLGLRKGILGRVTRLLERNATPRTLTWRGTVGVLVLITLGLSGYGAFLQWGSSALRDQERVALIDQAAAPYTQLDPWLPQPANEARPARIISGKVVTEEGLPLAGAELRFWAGDARTESGTQTKSDGSFQSRRPLIGPTVIRVRREGYAMRNVYAEAGDSELLEPIIVSKGLSVPVRVINNEGLPVPGARVHWAMDFFGPRKTDQTTTDSAGLAWVKHLPSDIPVYVRAEAESFATVGVGPLNADELNGKVPVEIRLLPGRSVKVRVVSEEDDKPVVGAIVRIDSIQPRWTPGTFPHPSWNYGGLATDASGEAALAYLRLDTSYRLRIEHKTTGGFTIALPSAPVSTYTVRIPQRRSVVVELKGFPENYRERPLVLTVRINDNSYRHEVWIKSDGGARLPILVDSRQSLDIEFTDPRLNGLNVKALSTEDFRKTVVVDYATLPPEQRTAELRRVSIKFMHDGREFFPSGRFYIHRKSSPYVWDADGFNLEPGKPLFAEWADGTRLKLTADWGLIGAVINLQPADAQKEIVIDAQRTELLVPVKPAGLVRAQVRDAGGNLVRTASLLGSTHNEIFSERRRISFSGNQSLGEWQASGPVEFSFRGTPIWAADGLVFARGPSARISARNPVADIVVSLPKTRHYEFRITDESGQGLAGVACQITGRFLGDKDVNPPFGLVSRTSQADGRVSFEAGVDFKDWSGLQLLVEAQRPGYARTSTAIDVEKFKSIPTIAMKPSVIFRVRIVNRATGRGVAGVELEVHEGATARFTPARITTDTDGWVEFNNLAAGQKFRLNYFTPRSLGLRLVEENEASHRAFRELTPADTGLVVYMEPK
jgi:beta-lactamase regulating signal transducer with metallopeptidase domain